MKKTPTPTGAPAATAPHHALVVPRPSAHVRRAIAVEAVCEVRAVDRVYAGEVVRETTAHRVLAAIEKLGAPAPPKPFTR